MKKVFRGNLYFLIVLLCSMILPIIFSYIYSLIGLTDVRIVLMLNHCIIFLIPAIIYVFITKCNVKETFRFNKLHLKDTLLIILLGIVAYPFMGCFSAISSLFFKNDTASFIQSISSTPYILLLLLVAVMPAITEEITLRGVVLSGYDKKSKFKAALMVGILFGIFHLDAQQFLYTAILGFILAYIVRVTNSIFSSMLLHFMINGISITLSSLLFNSSDYIDAATESIDLVSMNFDTKLLIMGSYIMVAFAFGALIHKIIKTLEKWNTQRGEFVDIESTQDGESKERIINIPFIMIVVVYLVFMIIEKIVFK